MKILALLAVVLLAACKPKAPAVEAAAPVAAPAPVPVAEQNAAEKYVSGLQDQVKKASDAKTKADAANKSASEANKVSQ
ncbi:MAG: hypothetical protein HY923_06900 [Elusimicrobia bacterium]|nr:hypothetical protein [Elusimicrobiota bacterium]